MIGASDHSDPTRICGYRKLQEVRQKLFTRKPVLIFDAISAAPCEHLIHTDGTGRRTDVCAVVCF